MRRYGLSDPFISQGADDHPVRLTLNEAETAVALSLSQRKVASLRKEGKLPYVQFDNRIVYPLAELNDFLARRCVNKPQGLEHS